MHVHTTARCGELITSIWTVPFTIAQPVSGHTGTGALAAEHVRCTGDGTLKSSKKKKMTLRLYSAGPLKKMYHLYFQ